jgi:hypothetical protein
VPVQGVGQQSAQQHADAATAGRDEPDEAHRPGPLARLGEQRHRQRQGDHRDDRAAEALDCTGRDQPDLRLRDAAGQRGSGEDGQPDQEEPPVAEQVAEPPAQQQEAAERQQVGVHDPRERGLGEAELGPDRRQCHVHDRRVQNDHQIAEAEHHQGQPAAAGVEVHRRAPRPEVGVWRGRPRPVQELIGPRGRPVLSRAAEEG